MAMPLARPVSHPPTIAIDAAEDRARVAASPGPSPPTASTVTIPARPAAASAASRPGRWADAAVTTMAAPAAAIARPWRPLGRPPVRRQYATFDSPKATYWDQTLRKPARGSYATSRPDSSHTRRPARR